MSEVWKFPLEIGDEQFVAMPEDADLLHVAAQNGTLCLWAQVIPSNQIVRRLILIRGTGHPIWQQPHVGTVQMGPLVWHVFDGGEGQT